MPYSLHEQKKEARCDLKAELETEMRKSSQERNFREAGFVSIKFVDALFKTTQPPKLGNSLHHDTETLKLQHYQGSREMKVNELEQEVRNTAPKF